MFVCAYGVHCAAENGTDALSCPACYRKKERGKGRRHEWFLSRLINEIGEEEKKRKRREEKGKRGQKRIEK